ncbi:hypothetical protein ASPZODRAFT_1314430 [Penicilliopsis zonata CBS 506.65]|uniref:Dipeptidyl-peptidase V n=1 Tax=Penicilliopsis zonata CBS 506.65 TaxID=1073090 RepID=A0A1L9S5I0_9EURO|nr:hypothetical protein ASPZODRAFT_1314430 [Penicilliopsis zonata CBS 506.65]OJJ42421.1 hypothetical protein ASPZODRAFT_1314430 [Penicilliopsis zonata CBS 506.65]
MAASIRFTPKVNGETPQCSPAVPNATGTHAVVTQSRYSFDTHTHTLELLLLDLATGSATVVTSGEGVGSPQWLPGSDRLIWLQATPSGYTHFMVTDIHELASVYTAGIIPGVLANLQVVDNGAGEIGYAVTGRANPDGSLYHPGKTDEDGKPAHSGRLYTSLFVRHWDSYQTPQKNAIFFGLLKTDGYGPRDKYHIYSFTNLMLFAGLEGVESPIPPFGGTADFSVRGNTIALIAKDPELSSAQHTACLCHVITLDSWNGRLATKPAAPVWSTRGLGGALSSPSLAPDGSLLIISQKEDGNEADRSRILHYAAVKHGHPHHHHVLFPSADGDSNWDAVPLGLTVTAKGELLVQVEEKGHGIFYYLPSLSLGSDLENLRRLRQPDGYMNAMLPLGRGSKFLVSTNSLVDSGTVSILDLSHSEQVHYQQVSSVTNGGKLAGLSPSQFEEVWYDGAYQGQQIHAWLTKPVDFDPAKKYPLVLLLHGGPQWAWSDSWRTDWHPGVFAEQGYIVFAPNPTGSRGFGHAFMEAITGSWGGLPYEDIKKGFEFIRQTMPYVDTDRAVALGASWAGYMVNWIQGQDFGREFKALVTQCGMTNLPAQMATDELYFFTHDHQGLPWQRADAAHQNSWQRYDPMQYAGNWKTPHLIIHGERDYRVVFSEGLAAFNILQVNGVDSAFLAFPDEGHYVANPENVLEINRVTLDWINKHVLKHQSALSPVPRLDRIVYSLKSTV